MCAALNAAKSIVSKPAGSEIEFRLKPLVPGPAAGIICIRGPGWSYFSQSGVGVGVWFLYLIRV